MKINEKYKFRHLKVNNYKLLILPILVFFNSTVMPIELDGKLNDEEWVDAQVYTSFQTVSPFTLTKAKYETEVKVFSNKSGIYFGIKSYQPTELNNKDITPRDSFVNSDKIQLILDFDKNGISAYVFEIGITGSKRDGIFSNENQFSNEWDGIWRAESSIGDDYWSAEFLIPWDVVSMKNNTSEFRELNWYVSRRITNLNNTYATVSTNSLKEQFLSLFLPLKIKDYSTSSLQLFGYATAQHKNGELKSKAGLDMFWKSGTGKQLTATLNPDFGQVESDRLVVNFSATETFFNERRSFFTENQSLYDVRGANNLRFVHTRRIGARPDIGGGSETDIDIAAKFTDKHEDFTYGIFTAIEGDGESSHGRDYLATRFLQKKDNYSLGLTSTFVNRPDIDRQALGYAFDYEYKWLDKFKLNSQIVTSHIKEENRADNNDTGMGLWSTLHHQINSDTQQTFSLSHYDDSFEINDFGYLPRNNLNTFNYDYDIRLTNYAQSSLLQQNQYGINFEHRRNDNGDTLYTSLSFGNNYRFKNASGIGWDANYYTSGYDDLISRGNGLVKTGSSYDIGLSYNSSNANKFRYHGSYFWFKTFSDGNQYSLHIHPSYYFKENVNVSLGVTYRDSNNWLNWRGDDIFARYNRKLINSTLDFNANISPKQELRLRLQWVAINAKANAQYQLDNQGSLNATNEFVDDFSLSNTALQLRYKYEVAPLSNIYFVYSRGARIFNNHSQSISSLFRPGFDNINGTNFVIKYRHQFF